MFGLMQPPAQDFAYRSVYSRCCQFQRQFYGMISIPLLSYDAVFFYLCAVDAGLVPESVIIPQRCCRLRTAASLDTASDAELGRFCGAMSVLLADTKLQDDLRDGGGLLPRLSRFALRKPVKQAVQYFHQLDSSFHALIGQLTTDQIRVESNRDKLTMEGFVKPTARAFAYIAKMMPGGASRIGFIDFLDRLGQYLAVATVAVDCALDWREDLKTGNCNPVRNEFEAATSARLAMSSLRLALEATKDYLGQAARSTNVTRLVCVEIDKKLEETYRAFYPPMTQVDAAPNEPATEIQTNCLCVSLAEKVGAFVTLPCDERQVRPFRKNKVESPKVFKCGCQLVSGLCLLVGCSCDQSRY